MNRQSFLIFIGMVFFGTSSAAEYEGFHVEPASVGDTTVKKSDLFKVGVASAADVAANFARERAQLRQGQLKTGLAKINKKLRSLLGLSPKPEPLIAGKFLTDMTAAEEEALERLHRQNQDTFASHVANQAVPTHIFTERARIGILKTRITTVLADKNNYSDAAHINELVQEVTGLLAALRATVEQKADTLHVQEVTDTEYASDNSYVMNIEESLWPLIEIQKAQKRISHLKLTWLADLAGKTFFGGAMAKEISATRQDIFKSMSPYLFKDSRAQDTTLQPWQLLLESAIRKQAFALCKPILLKEYATKSSSASDLFPTTKREIQNMKANVQQFLTDYESYQKGGVEALKIKSENELEKILGNSPAQVLPQNISLSSKPVEPVVSVVAPIQTEQQLQKPPVVVEQVPPVVSQGETQVVGTESLHTSGVLSLKDQAEEEQQKVADFLRKMKGEPKPVKPAEETLPAAVASASLTPKGIAQKKELLDKVAIGIETYTEQLTERVELMNTLLAKKPLQKDDIEKLLTTYDALENGLETSYVSLSKALDGVVNVFDQSVGGLGLRKSGLRDQLQKARKLYLEKINELQGMGLEKVLKTFKAAEDALNLAVAKQPSLMQRVGVAAGKQSLSSELVTELSKLVFWDSSASPVVQTTIRETALDYLGRGLPQGQGKVINDFVRQLAENRVLVLDAVTSENLEQAKKLSGAQKTVLEVFETEVEDSGIPKEMKKLIEGKISNELRTLNKVLSPREYIQEQINGLKKQLLEVIRGEMTLEGFEAKNSAAIARFISLPANSNGTAAELSEMNDLVYKRFTGAPQREAFFNALNSLQKIRDTFKSYDSQPRKVLGEAGIIESRASKLGPVLRLLFFDSSKPGFTDNYSWTHDAVQQAAVAVLKEAIEKEGFLTASERTVFQKVLSDYQSFKKEHDYLQSLAGVKEITELQKEKLQELARSMEASLAIFPTRYPNQHQATVNNPQVPDYILNFSVKIQSYLRTDLRRITELEKLNVVDEPQDTHSDTESLKTAQGSHSDVTGTTGTKSFKTAMSKGPDDVVSNTGSLRTAEGENRDGDFEDALPDEEALKLQIKPALDSIATLKTLAAQFSTHHYAVDSIGLAEQGLAMVTAFERSMPPAILRQTFDSSASSLGEQIETLKLLFNDAMNNQKLAVVVSLQALRSSVTAEFGGTVYPPLTAAFKEQVTRIITPQFEDSLSEDSAFKKFVDQELVNLESATGTKAFFTVLDQVQDALKDNEAKYAQKIGGLEDFNFVQDLTISKQGMFAAIRAAIPQLEDAYKLAIFKTLTDGQKLAFETKNPVLYQKLVVQEEAEALENRFVTLRRQFNEYIQNTYRDVAKFDTFTVEQVRELLQGGADGLGGVEKQLALYGNFIEQLKVSPTVDLAFELYDGLAPFYEKLEKIKEYFEDLKKSKVRATIGFWKKLKIRAQSSLWSIPPIPENRDLERFFADPLGYLKNLKVEAQQDIVNAQQTPRLTEEGGGTVSLSKMLEQEAQALQTEIEKGATGRELESLKSQLKTLEKAYEPLQKAYEKSQMVLDTIDQMLTSNASFTFEKDLQSVLGRQKTVEFIAQALSVPGSVYIPPSLIFTADRETLLARLVATGKTKGNDRHNQPYRDLKHVLNNDPVWALEVRKLEGKPFLLSKKQKKGMQDFNKKLLASLDPELEGDVRSLNGLFGIMNAALAGK